jgi:chorismate mutase/prephenate dehydratase
MTQSPSRVVHATRVGFLGPFGTFSHEAARAHFGAGSEYIEQASIPAVFDAVTRGQAEWGVVPIENSIDGGVNFTQDTLLETSLSLCGEVMLDVEQCLLSNAPDPTRLERVYSHPQGLAQCRRWLTRHLPGAMAVPTASTAHAAHLVRDDPTSGAIASRLAAELASVKVVHFGIQDSKLNVTRFVVLGSMSPSPTNNDKTSLVFSTPDERGALVRALTIFDQAGINLCRIESRPRTGATWEYVFFVDLEGHRDDAPVRQALAALEVQSEMVKVFGSYPRARPRPRA